MAQDVGIRACWTVAVFLAVVAPAHAQLTLRSCTAVGEPIRCGVLVRPENPGRPRGRSLSLGVLVAPSTRGGANKQAMFLLTGGPGSAATAYAASILEMLRSLRATHDIVLLDQRGASGAHALHCDVADGHLFVPRDPARCLAGLSSRADLRSYTTELFVDDLEAARSALGYERISLFGSSYGTRAAYVYAKRYSHRVRSVILVAPAPMSMPILDTFEQDGRAALDALLNDCLSDASCQRAFPRIRSDLEEVQTRSTDPLHQIGLQFLMYSSTTLRRIPLLLSHAAAGRREPLRVAIDEARTRLLSQISSGLHLAVFCSEDLPFSTPPTSPPSPPSALRREYERACQGWPRAVLPDDFRTSIQLDVPALIVSGSWDPVTPPRWARAAAEQFARSQVVVVPKAGHALDGLAPCLGAMTAEFVATSRADASCAARFERPPFAVSLER